MTCVTENLHRRLTLILHLEQFRFSRDGDPEPKGDSAGEEEQEDCPKGLSLTLV